MNLIGFFKNAFRFEYILISPFKKYYSENEGGDHPTDTENIFHTPSNDIQKTQFIYIKR